MAEKSVHIQVLKKHCQDLEISLDSAVLKSHGCDWTRFRKPAPAAVVFPRNIDDVAGLVQIAAEHSLPLVPSGGRTGLSGGAVGGCR